jgi:hypothetical protein
MFNALTYTLTVSWFSVVPEKIAAGAKNELRSPTPKALGGAAAADIG